MKLNEYFETFTTADTDTPEVKPKRKYKKRRKPRKDTIKKKVNLIYDFVQRIIENTNRVDLIKKLERFFGNLAKVAPPYDPDTYVPTTLQAKNFINNLEFAKDAAKTVLKVKPTDGGKIAKHKTLADLLRKVKGTKFNDLERHFKIKIKVMENMETYEKYLGEAFGRGQAMSLLVQPNNMKKAEKVLKSKRIKFQVIDNKIMVGDDDMDNAEDALARAGIF